MKQRSSLIKSYIGRLVFIYGLAVILALGALFYFRDTLATLQVDSYAKPLVDREVSYFRSVYEKRGMGDLIEILEDYRDQPERGFDYALIKNGKLVSGDKDIFAPQPMIFGQPFQFSGMQSFKVPENIYAPETMLVPDFIPNKKNSRSAEGFLEKFPPLRNSPESFEPEFFEFSEIITMPNDMISPFNFMGQNHILMESIYLGGGVMLMAAFDTRSFENPSVFLNRILIGLCLLIIAGFITTTFIGWKIHSRLNGINKTASDILKHNDLSRRIPGGSGGSEFDLLSRNLNNMLEGIEQKLEDMRQLSNNIAHDLRTPLTILRNRLETLGKNANKIEDEKEKTLLHMDGILETFNAILRISNLESGSAQLHKENINLPEMIQDVIDLYAPLATKKKQTLGHELDDFVIYADRNLLFQALANIIDNAVKYTPESGKIMISAEEKPLSFELYIDDTGSGIPADKLDKVLTRYERLDHSRNTSGHGLGLSLVKAIMDAHNGRLSLTNHAGGLRVNLSFPHPRQA
ncbi:MAG: HAMP domain-containing histidine kinase [Emcibacter sp.]|nr:HAMP domain-containing histidine kinase [Emcibacter sp.]